MADTCGGCDWNLIELGWMFQDEEKTLDFLCGHKLIRRTYKCPKCDSDLDIKKNFVFRCDRQRRVQNNKKSVVQRCRFFRSAKKNSWFSRSNLSVSQIIYVTYLWNQRQKTVKFCAREVRIDAKTVIDWFSFCREVAVDYCVHNSAKLGGQGKTVEVDEAKFDKRNYKGGRVIEGTWVVGGVERGSSKAFLMPVVSRDEETLLRVIQDNILPGTHIVTDCRSSYNSLSAKGYTHSTVKHSLNFVDRQSGVHTQNVQQEWREGRGNIPRFGRRTHRIASYLAESMFKRTFPDVAERFHHFLLHAATIYSVQ